jgi:hypothetical protein
MILDAISTSLDILNKSADFVKKLQEIEMNFKLPDEVKKINAKLDQDITRKIKSGYESIEFSLRKQADNDSRENDLEDARNSLRDCINLSEQFDTGGIPNGDVMAVAHYGLAIVYNLKRKRDKDKTAYHLLKAFQTGPRKTRELVPEIYNQLFAPECGSLATTIDRYIAINLATNNIPSQDTNQDEFIRGATEFGKEVLKGAAWLGGIGLYIASLGRIPLPVIGATADGISQGVNKVDSDFMNESIRRQRISQEAENIMKDREELANRQDDCCRKKAADYLTSLGFK